MRTRFFPLLIEKRTFAYVHHRSTKTLAIFSKRLTRMVMSIDKREKNTIYKKKEIDQSRLLPEPHLSLGRKGKKESSQSIFRSYLSNNDESSRIFIGRPCRILSSSIYPFLFLTYVVKHLSLSYRHFSFATIICLLGARTICCSRMHCRHGLSLMLVFYQDKK